MSSFVAATKFVEGPVRDQFARDHAPRQEVPPAARIAYVAPPAPSPAAPIDSEPATPARYEPLQFDTPQDFLEAIRPHVKCSGWQIDISNHFAGYFAKGQPRQRPTDKSPLLYNVVAANGAGKDSYIIAPFACWFACTKVKSRCIITSSSYDQLKNQTFKYISDMCRDVNELLGDKIFDIVEFKITCTKTGSEIKLFVTDEAGKAEGYHPDPTYPDAEMAVIVNEAKSIPDQLWSAFSRFTGYNYWIEISSPGGAAGHFYKTSTDPNSLRAPDSPQLSRRFVRFISAYECPWVSAAHIAQMIYEHGEDSAFVKSSIRADFTDIESGNYIKMDIVDRCRNLKPKPKGTDIGIGMDISAGGDEFTIYVRRGNEPIDKFFWRQYDTSISVELADKFLESYKDGDYVFNADNGGLGHPVIDQLVLRGWRIQRRDNQSPASAPRLFGNLGAQMYWHTKRLIERAEIIIPDDEKTVHQLTTRASKGEQSAQGKITLQSKKQARAQGLPSPDRADALVLCFFSYRNNPDDHREGAVETRRLIPITDMMRVYQRGLPTFEEPKENTKGSFTFLSGDLFKTDNDERTITI